MRVRSLRELALGVVGVLFAAAVAVLMGSGGSSSVAQVKLAAGSAWLASPARGLVTLVDGPSRRVIASVPTGNEGTDQLTVTQGSDAGYVGNVTKGQVRRVSNATFDAGRPVQLATAGQGMQVLAGPGQNASEALYVLDPSRRSLRVLDPRTLDSRAELSLRAEPGNGQSVVDAKGTLWAVDAGGRGLTWVAGRAGSKAGHRDGVPATAVLVLVHGRAALVDQDAGKVGFLAPDGQVSAPSCIDVRKGDVLQVTGSSTSNAVFAANSSTGTLVQAALGSDDCRSVVSVGVVGDTLGAIVESGPFVLVPNWTTGETMVIDSRIHRRAAAFPLAAAGHEVELLPRDGLVFYNDLKSSKAGVLSFDGVRWAAGEAIEKFDPKAPGADVLSPAGGNAKVDLPSAVPTQSATAQPSDSVTAPPKTAPLPAVRVTPTATPPVSVTPDGPPAGGAGSGTTTDTTPVVADITADPPVLAGAKTTLTGHVGNPSGEWTWTVHQTGLDPVTSHQTNTYTFEPSAGSAGRAVQVTLTVGASAPLQRTFVIGAPDQTATTTSVKVTPATVQYATPVTVNIVVQAPGGGAVPRGRVDVSFIEPLAADPKQVYGSVDLNADGSAEVTRQFPAPGQTVTVEVDYRPSDSHTASHGEASIAITNGTCALARSGETPDVSHRLTMVGDGFTLTGCIGAVAWTSPAWLTVQVPSDPLGLVLEQDVDGNYPPLDGLNPGALVAHLPDGKTAAFDVNAGRPPSLGSATCTAGSGAPLTPAFTVTVEVSDRAITTVAAWVSTGSRLFALTRSGSTFAGDIPRDGTDYVQAPTFELSATNDLGWTGTENVSCGGGAPPPTSSVGS